MRTYEHNGETRTVEDWAERLCIDSIALQRKISARGPAVALSLQRRATTEPSSGGIVIHRAGGRAA